MIIYYSHSNTTKAVAEKLSQFTQDTLFRLVPQTAEPVDETQFIAADQQALAQQQLPALKTAVPDLAAEETIFIGFPTWWGQPPQIIQTLFAVADLSGKQIIPFTTSASDPITTSLPVIKQLAKQAQAQLAPGFRYQGEPALRAFLQAQHLSIQ